MSPQSQNAIHRKWKRFFSNPLSTGSIIFVLLLIFLALFAYPLIPDKTEHANSQHIEISTRKPGFTVKFLKRKVNEWPERKTALSRFFTGRNKIYDYYSFSTFDIDGDSIRITEYTPVEEEQGLVRRFHLVDIPFSVEKIERDKENGGNYRFFDNQQDKIVEISREDVIEMIENEMIVKRIFLLGTDRFGRDFLSRLVLGARISLSVGFIAVFISLLIGILLGLISGYYEGWVDNVIMWFVNVIWSIPTLLLVIALTMVLGKGFWQIFVAVGLTMWVEVARVVRGEVKSHSKLEYVDAARVTGLNDFRILIRHILPNVVSPVIIIAASNFASAILIEAGLSFLGIGVQPPVASWGSMIRDHYGYIIVDKAYLAFIPGLAIMLLVLSFTLIGNGLRDAFDVKGK